MSDLPAFSMCTKLSRWHRGTYGAQSWHTRGTCSFPCLLLYSFVSVYNSRTSMCILPMKGWFCSQTRWKIKLGRYKGLSIWSCYFCPLPHFTIGQLTVISWPHSHSLRYSAHPGSTCSPVTDLFMQLPTRELHKDDESVTQLNTSRQGTCSETPPSSFWSLKPWSHPWRHSFLTPHLQAISCPVSSAFKLT